MISFSVTDFITNIIITEYALIFDIILISVFYSYFLHITAYFLHFTAALLFFDSLEVKLHMQKHDSAMDESYFI